MKQKNEERNDVIVITEKGIFLCKKRELFAAVKLRRVKKAKRQIVYCGNSIFAGFVRGNGQAAKGVYLVVCLGGERASVVFASLLASFC